MSWGRGLPGGWAGWTVVAVDDLGNLKSVAHGAVPIDVLAEQTSKRYRGLSLTKSGAKWL